MAVLQECCICRRKQSIKNKLCVSCETDLATARRSGRVVFWIVYRVEGKQHWERLNNSLQYAKDAEGKRKVQRREKTIFDIKAEERWTFSQLVSWYLGLEKVKALASYTTVKVYLKKFNRDFGNILVSQIKPADLESLQVKRRGEGMADGTIDNELAAIKICINKAFDNDLISVKTWKAFKRVKKLLKRGRNRRDRVITLEEFQKILGHLPEYSRAILVMGFYTGMRRGEILSLRWPQVDMENRLINLEATQTKDREARVIPICQDLYDVLKGIPRAVDDNHVILYSGRPLVDPRGSLRKACQEAGVPYGRFTKGGFIFHDLRHTFNTNMRKAGTAQSVRMAVTGHSTPEMENRYDTVDVEDMRTAVDRMTDFLQGVSQNVNQRWN